MYARVLRDARHFDAAAQGAGRRLRARRRGVAIVKAVLDTNVWLDWLVFGDPGIAPLRAAHAQGALEIVVDAACEAELARVLAYPLGRWTLDGARQQECLAQFKRIGFPIQSRPGEERMILPVCRDQDDQKFLQLALAAGADVLLTKDAELLRLERRALPFRILNPRAFNIPTRL